MKKRSVKKEKATKRFFNKLGMTYVELLCALSLLSLIVVMFTPMLLSSYDTLYKAGERVEAVYDSKEEIETGLATRFKDTNITISNVGFKNNAKSLFGTMNVKLKKVVSTIHKNLETAFGTGRASVDIISPSIVYDNQDNHDVVIQTSGIEYSKVKFGRFDYTDEEFIKEYNDLIGSKDSEETGLIFIEVSIPDKNSGGSTTDFVAETSVYGDILANIKINDVAVSNDTYYNLSNISNDGRIEFNISGSSERLDFTQSPVRICVYYVNTRNKVRSTSDYLVIEPPSMIFAGEAEADKDYYTSAGVEKDETVISSLGASGSKIKVTYNFEAQGRNMNVSNSGLLGTADIPSASGSGSKIQTITWVEGDENSYFRPYYVMAGTNSRVYRMYNYNHMTDLATAFASVGVTASATVDSTDGSTILSDGTQAHPSFWSGEMSDYYSFQTLDKASTYGAAEDNKTDCSAPDSASGAIGTQYNKFGSRLRYSMIFNSYRTGYKYASQMSRKISYTLTEAGNLSFRIAGKKMDEGDFTYYHYPWENSSDRTFYEGGMFSANTDSELAIYMGGEGSGLAAKNAHTDMHLGYLRLNSYISFDPIKAVKDNKTVTIADGADTDGGTATMSDRLIVGGEFWFPTHENKNEEGLRNLGWKDRVNYIDTEYGCNVNVTSAIYLPGSSSSSKGQVIYLGSVPAYALLQQRSDTNDKTKKMYNTDNAASSKATFYYISGSQGNGTTIYRNSYNCEESSVIQGAMRDAITNEKTNNSITSATAFYTVQGDSLTYKYNDSDLEFTFGYCSRWRMAVGDVTYNGTTEETKSYEKYYKASNTSAAGVRKPGINKGNENNLYYNVWFPGEFYNLTAADTCDEVTVAVGYTVSGSTYMSQSWSVGSGYYGTALGSVYNDGVLALYTESGSKVSSGLSGKGEQNIIFENSLYYKSSKFIADSVTSGITSTLHARENIRFTAVGLFALTNMGTQTKDYYAVYGDNHGNAYYSIVATSKVEVGEPKKDENGNIVYDESGEPVLESKESNVNLRTEKGGDALSTSEAYPVLINNQPLSQYFSEITTIEAEEGFVVISGIPLEGKNEVIVILSLENGTWRFYSIENKDGSGNNFKGQINQAMLLGGYYYFCGGDSGSGWVAAVEVETLKSMKQGDYLTTYKDSAEFTKTVTETTSNGETTVTTTMDKYAAVYCETDTALYALGGRLTEG